MKYYIYKEGENVEVSCDEYENWMTEESSKYLMPEYSAIINGNYYGLETMFFGSIDKGEEVLPFVLLYFEDVATILENKLDIDLEANTVDYFATFEELKQHYEEKLREIKTKEILQ
ncbi:MAG TPA: hypothetical protein VJY62_09155 [Bacteroidia bacterium]|nr:hypothetical protein [Bacteroidia bacterium]